MLTNLIAIFFYLFLFFACLGIILILLSLLISKLGYDLFNEANALEIGDKLGSIFGVTSIIIGAFFITVGNFCDVVDFCVKLTWQTT